jgi:Domain of unknown function DUF1828
MNCDSFESLIGMRCNPIGDSVEVVTPFSFADGDGIDVFAQARGPQVHFFDDGFTLMHLHSVGIHLGSDKKRWKPLRTIAEVNGISLSDDGVFETLCPTSNASHGFACLVSTILGVASWEREQMGVAQDSAWFVDEVAMYLKAWKPGALIIDRPTVQGISGRSLKFNFQIANQYIDAIQPNGHSTGSELRKIVDLSSISSNLENEVLVVVDDRTSPKAAKQEISIIGRVAKAWPMTALISASGGNQVAN